MELSNLEEKFQFIELLDEMKYIKRCVLLKDDSREDDAQHSFHLASMAMILLDDYPVLDSVKVYKLALLHDIVEIYAGDVAFLVDKKGASNKIEKENKALELFEEELGVDFFMKYRECIEDYINQVSKESQFVYQLDKIQPIMQYLMEGGKGWRKWRYKKEELFLKYDEIFKKNQFGLKQVVEKYFAIAEGKGYFD